MALGEELSSGKLAHRYRHSMSGASRPWQLLGLDSTHIGVDIAQGRDHSCWTIMRRPGRLRAFLRRIGVDRSTWEFKIIRQIYR